jgi:hypothetical protein
LGSGTAAFFSQSRSFDPASNLVSLTMAQNAASSKAGGTKTSNSSGEVVNLSPSFPLNKRYRSAMVDVWVIEGTVEQIMVHDGYRGKLMGKIGLGSTVADIERHIGAVEEDEEDNLVIRDFPGLFFEVEGYFSEYFPELQQDPAFRIAPIKEINVVNLSSLPS